MRRSMMASWVIVFSLGLAGSASAQIVQEGATTSGSGSTEAVPPPPAASAEPAPILTPAPSPTPAPGASAAAYQQPVYGQPVYAQPVYGQPVYGQPAPVQPAPRRGDRLEDTANAGEIVDLMITTGAYGIFLGNSIVTWANLDETFDPVTGATLRSGDDVVRIRFLSTFLGATLSLTGLLAMDAPRGVPTTMAMGLRFGVAFSAFGAGAAWSGGSGDDFLAVMSVGGLVGMGLGAGLGFGLRPHPSRARFVETGFVWGTAFGAMLGGALSSTGGLGIDGQAVLGGMLAGGLGAMTTHAIIAALTPVHVGRGWLMNAAFAGGSGIAALFTWGFGGGSVSVETYLATMSATGFVALAIVFAVTDGIQDPGWDESVPDVVRSLQLDVAPTQGGAVGTLRGQF